MTEKKKQAGYRLLVRLSDKDKTRLEEICKEKEIDHSEAIRLLIREKYKEIADTDKHLENLDTK